jgi:hypothetical protein
VYDPVPLPDCANLKAFAFSHYLETKPLPVPPELEELEEYSSTFFDEYGEICGDGSDGTSDDDFDETTLWEIANLLHSQDVPSRNSLLPPPRIIEDYDDDDCLGEEITESIQVYDQVNLIPPQSPLVMVKPLNPATPPLAQLWVKSSEQTASRREISIEQPENHIWQAYLSHISEPVRTKPRNASNQAPLSNVTSMNLWENTRRALSSQPVRGTTKLWNQQTMTKDEDPSLPNISNRPSENASVSGQNISTALKPTETQLKPASPHRASIRGSKVLASCDLWESKVEASALGHDAAKRTWRFSKLVVPDVFQQDAALEEAASRISSNGAPEKMVGPKSSQLWTLPSPVMPNASSFTLLWTAPIASTTDVSPCFGQEAEPTTIRKASKSLEPPALPEPISTSLWRVDTSTECAEKHWLHGTSLREAQST